LQLGMTRDQVKFLMGTAVAASPFTDDRWDYIGYYKSPRGEVSTRSVTLYFAANKLNRMDGIQVASASTDKGMQAPDAKTVIQQQKKEKTEDSRAESEKGKDSGVVLTPPNQIP
jgi:outer membrane protein assembly factor BamE